MTLNAEIYEVEYSVPPGGVDCWEITIQDYGHSTCISDFKNAGEALNYLLDKYPHDELQLNIRSLSWYRERFEETYA